MAEDGLLELALWLHKSIQVNLLPIARVISLAIDLEDVSWYQGILAGSESFLEHFDEFHWEVASHVDGWANARQEWLSDDLCMGARATRDLQDSLGWLVYACHEEAGERPLEIIHFSLHVVWGEIIPEGSCRVSWWDFHWRWGLLLSFHITKLNIDCLLNDIIKIFFLNNGKQL